jgi:Protein of unknown function (DUF1501)
MVNVFWTYFDKQRCQFNLWDNHGVASAICRTGGMHTGEQMIRHPYCTPSFDRAFPALLEDLDQRGLLDETCRPTLIERGLGYHLPNAR